VLKMYLSNDATIEPENDKPLATLRMGAVNAGKSVKKSFKVKIPAKTAKGKYYVGLQVNASGAVIEFNTGNNLQMASKRLSVKK
jgi:hypothetical protein